MRTCDLTGISTRIGVTGRHRHSGAWAMKAPSTQKIWYPNLHSISIKIDGATKRLKVTTKALRMLKANGGIFTRQEAKALGLI
ncbi:MAG: 50S ribosomal protein L28 [bacterium]|nr:50S ribosomal protein L28 [bacterium]